MPEYRCKCGYKEEDSRPMMFLTAFCPRCNDYRAMKLLVAGDHLRPVEEFRPEEGYVIVPRFPIQKGPQ